ncbi:Metallo-dependent phosphatase-like protein [Exophiala viscosa]|uniref:Metallo-dependent phosphatase-like protein n=1 Tax=Exophiala viscosa TaxID=2486360 RepID=A0AAN6IHR3_9EURO|nr:Metallo-dependent phosphatase-like protein [Exophiala viscosa]KAI1627665.1 Metallo-dependent phosphatase-like protein [Exophiala viscosa]
MAPTVQTRLLIMSDTHGVDFSSENRPLQHVDVALHCGDLTDGSKLEEFRTTLQMLKMINAPLKLVIAGNHDFTMDSTAFETKVAESVPPLEPELVAREYGILGQARQLFDDARDAGIVFLAEGTHGFVLENGAMLTIYASPFTPSLGAWGFQYHPNKGRHFDIQAGTDIVMTHGPPKGIMDFTYGRERAGCPDLFAAVAYARPRIHCFGHIHEGWGARLVAWKDSGADKPSHFTVIDNEKSPVIEKLATLRENSLDSDDMAEEKRVKLERLNHNGCSTTSHCAQDEYPLQSSKQTLFINASIMGSERFVQRPWLVDIELPRHRKSQ